PAVKHRLHDGGERESEDRSSDWLKRPAFLGIAISIGKDHCHQTDHCRNRETREATLVRKQRAIERPSRYYKRRVHREHRHQCYHGVSSATNSAVDYAWDHLRGLDEIWCRALVPFAHVAEHFFAASGRDQT